MQKSRKPGENKIIAELEKGAGTFTELKARCGLADSTLSEHLRTLEEKGDVTREYKDRKFLIKLTDKAAKPIERALRHLGVIYPLLDIDLGRKLLTNDVVDTILVTSTLYPGKGKMPNTPECPHPASWKCHKEEERELEEIGIMFKLELDEYHLLKALTRYDCERRWAGSIEYTGKASDLLKIGLQEWVERGAEVVMKKASNPKTFPVLGSVRKRGMLEKFDALLEWIDPLVDLRSEEDFMKKPNGQYIMKWLVPPPSEGTRNGGITSAIAVNGKIGVHILHDGVRLWCEINEDNLETELEKLSNVLVPTDVDKEGAYELRRIEGRPIGATDLALMKAKMPPDIKLPKPDNLAEAVFLNEGNQYRKFLSDAKGGVPRRRAKIASYPPRLISFLDRYHGKERKKEKGPKRRR